MSLVGPRPPLPAEVAEYPSDMRRRLVVKPGLTGLWQVSGRAELSWEETIRLDLRYVENWSLWLDLVILAVEWGHGRRQGWLSNLHLGARDPSTGEFVMLGKTFKGLTDAMLTWQTQKLQELETHRDRWSVYVRPELVAEIAFDTVQRSSRYPGGVALRFARVVRYRPDKRPEEADTIETVRTLGF